MDLKSFAPRVLGHGGVLEQRGDVGAELAVAMLTLPVLAVRSSELSGLSKKDQSYGFGKRSGTVHGSADAKPRKS